MTKNDLVSAQQNSLELMDIFHNLCTKLKLKYYIIGGTLLGAVRHKGFIPWDIDLDVAMPRIDYEKLKEYYLHYDDGDVFYSHYLTNKSHSSPHAVLYLKGTKFIDLRIKSQLNEKWRGLILDVFPLDESPLCEKEIIAQSKKLHRIKRILYYKNLYVFEKNSKFVVFLKKSLRMLLKLLPYRFLLKKLDKIEQKYNGVNSNYFVSMSSGYSYKKQYMKKEIYGEPVLYDFSGRKYFGVNNFDSYLSQLYGDYMTPAPHNDIFDEFKYFVFENNRKVKTNEEQSK